MGEKTLIFRSKTIRHEGKYRLTIRKKTLTGERKRTYVEKQTVHLGGGVNIKVQTHSGKHKTSVV